MSPETTAPAPVPRGRRRCAASPGATSATRRMARDAESRSPLRFLARGGFAANGVVHAVVGVIVLVIAAGGRGESDQAGAMKAIAAAPLGVVVLWLLAVTLAALGCWHVLDGILVRAPKGDAKGATVKWGRRAAEWGQAVLFLLLAALTASVALGGRPDGEDAAEGASRDVLSLAGGGVVMVVTALAIGGCGIAFLVMGVLRSFRKKMDLPRNGLGGAVTALGVVGFIAKGAALVVVGVLLLIAAVTLDPSTAAGLDGAVDALLAVTYGRWIVAFIGAGLVAYGLFGLFRARYARL